MADESDKVNQDEIEDLLRQAQQGESSPGHTSEDPPGTSDPSVDEAEIEAPLQTTPDQSVGNPGVVSQNDIELLLNKAEEALASVDSDKETSSLPSGLANFEFKKLGGSAPNSESATIELMRDVQLDMTVELGRTYMELEDVLRLKQGAVVSLDKLAGDPADIYVNGRLIARGEILVLNDNFCIRVAELIVGESACE